MATRQLARTEENAGLREQLIEAAELPTKHCPSTNYRTFSHRKLALLPSTKPTLQSEFGNWFSVFTTFSLPFLFRWTSEGIL